MRPGSAAPARPPNIIVILADDLGYGDLGCQGGRVRTPHIDSLARDGVRMTHFYSASGICSPSRASLLTGRYAVRMNIPSVLFPDDARGIPDSETTMPQMLRQAGYRTGCVGKWHIGSRPQFLPTARGFDEFFGLPYSHDMLPLAMMRQSEAIEEAPRLEMLTQRFTAEAKGFVTRNRERPFFLMVSHTAPHIPLRPGPGFRGRSRRGVYADSIEELDWSVGEILRAVEENGLDGNTLVIFTSDNGPWYLGSKSTLRGRKGETYEGGMRVPFVARYPGAIPAGRVVSSMATMLDLLPTVAGLSGAAKPGLALDGVDIWPLLAGKAEDVEREMFLYFDSFHLQCARWGPWKLHFARYNTTAWMPGPPEGRLNLPLVHPELYHMDNDPEESYEESEDNPEVVEQMRRRVEQLLLTFPDPVRNAWRDTQRQPVEDTPVGAPPVLRRP